MSVHLAGIEHYRGEVCLVGAVGDVLCLEADGAALGEGSTMSTLEAAVPVGGVHLYARLGGVALDDASAVRLYALGCKAQLAWLALVEHPAVVITYAELGLLVVSVDAVAHHVRLAEVHRSALYMVDAAVGD